MLISYLPSFACRRMILGGVRKVGGKKIGEWWRREEGRGREKGEGGGISVIQLL